MENNGMNGNFEEYKQEEYRISDSQLAYEEEIRRRMKERRRRAEQRRVRRNRTVALLLFIVIVVIIVKSCSSGSNENSNAGDTSSNEVKTTTVFENAKDGSSDIVESSQPQHVVEVVDGLTFVDGILIVNKTYSLPSTYDPGTSAVAQNAFNKMAQDASNDGIFLYVNSGYRSYQDQEYLYNNYATERGVESADEVSSRPGHSEHQTGLTFDVNTTEFSFEGTPEAVWLEEHCADYGFIIRYPKNKEDITGYTYEPWHIRYLGVETAKKVTESGLCLEEYLGVTSDYKYADDMSQ